MSARPVAGLDRHPLELALDLAGVWAWDWNLSTGFCRRWGNPTVGLESDAVEEFLELVHPHDRPGVESALLRARRYECDYEMEFRLVLPSGHTIWVLDKGKLRSELSTGQLHLTGVCVDITERKWREFHGQLLNRLHSTLSRMQDAEGIIRQTLLALREHLGLDGAIFCDLAAGRSLSIGEQDYRKRPRPADETRPFIEVAREAMAQGEPVVVCDASSDARIFDRQSLLPGVAAFICIPRSEESGLMAALVVYSRAPRHWRPDEMQVVTDVTARLLAAVDRALTEDRLRASEERLREIDRRKDEFLATLAHELRNPLAPLRNGLHLLRSEASSAASRQQALGMMDRQLGHLVRLVDDLLDVSRITTGKINLRMETVDLGVAAQSAIESVRTMVETSAHQLTVTYPPRPLLVLGDATRLAQAMANLLGNASKYTDRGGHIWLTLEQQADEAVISVRDTGIGISGEQLGNLFEMFAQLAPALERSQGGLGIGLSLVKGLVTLHGGKVEARSAGLGLGSVFIIRLPLARATRGTAATPQVEDIPLRSACKVLLADDNRDSADSLHLMLEFSGHEVRVAYDGVEALQAASAFKPSVAVLDIGMPKMNGYEVARQIRCQEWGKHMTLIALTGWGQDEDKKRAMEAGFDHHVVKPVDPGVLTRLLAGTSEAAP